MSQFEHHERWAELLNPKLAGSEEGYNDRLLAWES